MTKDELKFALEALEGTIAIKMGNIDVRGLAISAVKQALAQPAPVQSAERGGAEYRCCPHTSDCAVHNMPAYPTGPCDCAYSNTFNLPSSSEVHEVCLKLATRELEKLTNENFGRTPNDTWTNKIVDVYDFFDSNPRAKKLTEIYTTHTPAAQPEQEPALVTAAQKVMEEFGTSSDGLQELYQALKLYTTPPAAQRTWVNLTPQDLNEVFKNASTGEGAVHLALAKFKEINT
jgi:hypothetical protein